MKGVMYISTPNLKSILDKGNNPNSVLHFEHTFYFDDQMIEFLSKKSGFQLVEKEKYNEHSVFFKLQKISEPLTNITSHKFEKNSLKIISSFEKYSNFIEKVNKMETDFILFGCHISSQFLISNGLDINKIKFVIDNSVSKQNKYLYGTELKTLSPSEILNFDLPVLVSHMGVYSDEIKSGLKKIKNNVILL
jgi:hypothetical protein